MKAPRLARIFLWILAVLAFLAAFVVLDWFPTVKELGRLRRERSDLERKIKNYNITASGFVFPDGEEEKHFINSRICFGRELPWMESDAAWLRGWLANLRRQAEKDSLAGALLLFAAAPGGEVEPAVRLTGQGPESDWLATEMSGIRKNLNAASPSRFPWKSLFTAPSVPLLETLASRPLAIILAAPLPALLNFINHISWSCTRLEIVSLRLEPGPGLSRAWLVCRSSYQVRAPSPWAVPMEPGGAAGGLLVDPDSPLLWQRVDPGIAYRAEKIELPPAAGRGGE